jgi:hypothetical protein
MFAINFNNKYKVKSNPTKLKPKINHNLDLDTSPFISSEMYNNLLNSKTSDMSELKQMGGAKKKKKQVGHILVEG